MAGLPERGHRGENTGLKFQRKQNWRQSDMVQNILKEWKTCKGLDATYIQSNNGPHYAEKLIPRRIQLVGGKRERCGEIARKWAGDRTVRMALQIANVTDMVCKEEKWHDEIWKSDTVRNIWKECKTCKVFTETYLPWNNRLDGNARKKVSKRINRLVEGQNNSMTERWDERKPARGRRGEPVELNIVKRKTNDIDNKNFRYGTVDFERVETWERLHETSRRWDNRLERTVRGEPIERRQLIVRSGGERSGERETAGGPEKRHQEKRVPTKTQ